MQWLRQVSPTAFLFLAFLLHCSQMCLAVGHAHAAVSIPVSTHSNPERAPCHSSPVTPAGLPEKCPDCSDHAFLPSVASGAETLAAAGSVFSPVCFLMSPALFALPQAQAGVWRLDNTALSPPLHRTLSVLRL